VKRKQIYATKLAAAETYTKPQNPGLGSIAFDDSWPGKGYGVFLEAGTGQRFGA